MATTIVTEQGDTSKGKRIALSIGINEAPRSLLSSLNFASNDALEIAQVLQKHCSFRLLEPPLVGEEATSARVKRAILELARDLNDEDFLLLYFSGHGVPMAVEADRQDVYLVTYDFDERAVEQDESFHLSLRWLRDILYEQPAAGQVLIILDCAYSSQMAQSGSDPYLKELQQRLAYYFDAPSRDRGRGGQRLTLSSTGPMGPSFEKDGHGLMTYWLLQALQGRDADVLGKNGEVSLQRLFEYLANHMPPEQQPMLSGTTAGRACILAIFPLSQEDINTRDVEMNSVSSPTAAQEVPQVDNARTSADLSSQISQEANNVPTYMDQPALKDELGRKPLAEALAIRIRKIRDYEAHTYNSGSFTINIHGTWGSGKTSLLNLLKKELQYGGLQRWIVVDYNAWKHQHLGSLWWWLMSSVVKQGSQQLWHLHRWRSINLRFREYIWRFRSTGWPPYILACLALALVLWIMSLNGFFGLLDISIGKVATGTSKTPIQQIADSAQAISAIVALILTIWAIILGLMLFILILGVFVS